MPILESNSYQPPFLLRNGHINTLYPYYLRKNQYHKYSRERIKTKDNDYFDVDWLTSGKNKRLCILLHGLEGSSSSQYILGSAHAFYQHGFDIAALNFRSCSGTINEQLSLYHSGFTVDLDQFINTKVGKYEEIFICGFSLGGNVTLKYTGEYAQNLSQKIKAVAGVSVPCDLKGGSIKLKEFSNYFYEQKFLKSLKDKIIQKHFQFPEKVNISKLNKINTLWDFDEHYTSTLHGFQNAEDYYTCCNSKQFLNKINVPALIINALDDSFLSLSCYPYDEAENNQNIFLMTPKHGGHVGFTTFGKPFYWSEYTVLHFFLEFSTL